MLFYTGMREGEMLGRRWEDIDWPRHLIDLRRTVAFRNHRLIVNTPKSGKLRTIDVPAALTASLRELHSIRQAQTIVDGAAMSPWIFRSATDSDKPMNDAWFRDWVWRPLLEKAEIRHIRVHDARHTYAADAPPRRAHRLHLEAARALLDPGHRGPLRSFHSRCRSTPCGRARGRDRGDRKATGRNPAATRPRQQERRLAVSS